MAEQPALHRIHVIGYSANDRDFPIVSLVADPRIAGYQVPKDLSACPDKRYPNHVFTGAQPISGDQRVRHVWEILPSPWVPFTRYDDDLGPVQGRRRSVKNEGQVAVREADKQVTYEAREGSAIVYTELEESWSIKTDEDGNSLFPIRDRDFYDASRGPVQERRQLFVPTGEEVGSLENVNGVITQTSYEPYNDFLSVKIVQTYRVDGPQLVGNATNNEGQLVTVTTQRKGAKDYVAPAPTATRTVESSREDAESIVERIVDTPEVFAGQSIRVSRTDSIPEKFRTFQRDVVSEETAEGQINTNITLGTDEFSKSEQQVTNFLKRIATTSREQKVVAGFAETVVLSDQRVANRSVTLNSGSLSGGPSLVGGEVEYFGDNYVITSITAGAPPQKGSSFSNPSGIPSRYSGGVESTTVISTDQDIDTGEDVIESRSDQITEYYYKNTKATESVNGVSYTGQEYDPSLNIVIPYTETLGGSVGPASTATPATKGLSLVKTYNISEARNSLLDIFIATNSTTSLNLPPTLESVEVEFEESADNGYYTSTANSQITVGSGFEAFDSASISGSATVTPRFVVTFKENSFTSLPSTNYVYYSQSPSVDLGRVGATGFLPTIRPISAVITAKGQTKRVTVSATGGYAASIIEQLLQEAGNQLSLVDIPVAASVGSQGKSSGTQDTIVTINIPPCFTTTRTINAEQEVTATATINFVWSGALPTNLPITSPLLVNPPQLNIEEEIKAKGSCAFTIPQSDPPEMPTGSYIINSRVDSAQYGLYRIFAEVVHIGL
jgi:hypothetical protein